VQRTLTAFLYFDTDALSQQRHCLRWNQSTFHQNLWEGLMKSWC